jgi:enterochelin esterase family protein
MTFSTILHRIVRSALFALAILPAAAQVSPEILPDGRVTFRCRARNATEVKAAGQFGDAVIMKDAGKGLWEGTTGAPVAPGVFEYHISIDGRRGIDARNSRIKPQRWPGSSILHVPATPPAPWDLQDIPHGTLHRHDYMSKSLGKWREIVVYTPPGTHDRPLPVFYLAHGYSDNQRTWTEHGMTHHVLDALIHTGTAQPMIVVMPDAHAIEPGDRKFAEYGSTNTAGFCKDLMDDVIPFVESHYPVQKDAAGRAFAGLSMGGGHALTIALAHSDTFSHIGAFSAATPSDQLVATAAKQADAINKQLDLLWIACGDKDFLFKRNETLHAAFEKAGIKHAYHITEGDDHSWPVWRRYLADFAPLLFQE